jgi:hypothetical protein
LAVFDALRHHLCRPDPCLELLGKVLCLELDKVLVRLVRSCIVAAVPLARGEAWGLSSSRWSFPGTCPWDLRTGPACATMRTWPWGSSLCRDWPRGRPWDACCRSCRPCRPPPEVHRADLPLLVLGLLRNRDARRQASQVRGLGHLDQLGRLCLAGGCADVVLLDGGRVDRAGDLADHTLDGILPAGGLSKLVVFGFIGVFAFN